MNKTTQNRTAIYARYSGHEMGSDAIERQLTSCREFAVTTGLTVEGEYVDQADHPTRSEDRPAFQQLLQKAKEGTFDIVLVEEVDRVSRNLAQIVDFQRTYGVPLRTPRGFSHTVDFTVVEPWIAEVARKHKRAARLMAAGRRAAKARRLAEGEAGPSKAKTH